MAPPSAADLTVFVVYSGEDVCFRLLPENSGCCYNRSPGSKGKASFTANVLEAVK